MGHILKNKQKDKCVCIYEIIRMIICEINHSENEAENEKKKIINRPRSRHGHKYSKYKKCLIMTMLICIKQHFSNI